MTNHIIRRSYYKKKITFASSLMSQVTMFPVSKPTTSFIERTNGKITVRVTPSSPEQWVYGKTPRLVFLYIQSMIASKDPDVDVKNRTVTLRGSFSEFCRKIGLARNGSVDKDVNQMLVNLAETHIAVERGLNRDGLTDVQWAAISASIADKVWNNSDSKKIEISIQFSEMIWNELRATSVPMDMNVIANLGKSARAIDVYIWCRYRINGLKRTRKDVFVTWESLFLQFEASSMPMAEFRRKFKFALAKVKEQCPEYVVLCDDDGVTIPYAENKNASKESNERIQRKSEFDNGNVIDCSSTVTQENHFNSLTSTQKNVSDLVDAKAKIMFDQFYDSLGLYRDAQYSRKLRVFAEQLENGLSPDGAFVISLR